ncbi:cell division/cell wall cluster transcriptional repressor MraZ [Patescibacteria group bacterium]|nr:cell division/cell wall cluster transcriptional repressor MraZ [Patescibacteria group bacterium]
MFLGEYQTKFSGKGRIVLPKLMRQELGGNKAIVLSRGFEGCIWGFSQKGFEEEAKRQLEISATEERARLLRRYIFSGSIQVKLDAQGRFVIPDGLAAYAKTGLQVIVIGAGDHFEIWNVDLWKKHLKEVEKEYARLS